MLCKEVQERTMVESHSKMEIRKGKVEENKMKFAITQIFWHIYKVVIGTFIAQFFAFKKWNTVLRFPVNTVQMYRPGNYSVAMAIIQT